MGKHFSFTGVNDMQLGSRSFIALLVISCVCAWTMICSAVELSGIAQKGATQCRRIGSIEFKVRPGIGYDYRYIHDGEKFRVDYLDATLEQPAARPTRIISFDGSDFHQQDASGHFVTKTPASSQLIPVSNNPLFVTLYWLFAARSDYTWSAACDATAWSEVLAKGTYRRDDVVDGIACHVVRLDFPRADADVWFARDHGCFPVRWKSFAKNTDEPISQAEVLRHKIVPSGQVELFVPVESRFAQAGGAGAKALDQTSTIDESTLKVNELFYPRLFTLE